MSTIKGTLSRKSEKNSKNFFLHEITPYDVTNHVLKYYGSKLFRSDSNDGEGGGKNVENFYLKILIHFLHTDLT